MTRNAPTLSQDSPVRSTENINSQETSREYGPVPLQAYSTKDEYQLWLSKDWEVFTNSPTKEDNGKAAHRKILGREEPPLIPSCDLYLSYDFFPGINIEYAKKLVATESIEVTHYIRHWNTLNFKSLFIDGQPAMESEISWEDVIEKMICIPGECTSFNDIDDEKAVKFISIKKVYLVSIADGVLVGSVLGSISFYQAETPPPACLEADSSAALELVEAFKANKTAMGLALEHRKDPPFPIKDIVKAPANIEECLEVIYKQLSVEMIEKFRGVKNESDVTIMNDDIYDPIRTMDLGFWDDSPLFNYFNKLGISSYEDMYEIIFLSFWRKVHDMPIQFENQVQKKREYLEEHKKKEEEERIKVAEVKDVIRSRMMNLKVEGEAKEVVRLPDRQEMHCCGKEAFRVIYMSPFRNGMIIKTGCSDFDFYFFDQASETVREIQLPEVEKIDDCVVAGDRAYFHGITKGEEVLLELRPLSRKRIVMPPGSGWLGLGTDNDHVLAVRPSAIYRFENQRWKNIYKGELDLPILDVPPMQIGNRIYFRPQERAGDERMLAWLDLGKSVKLEFFHRHIGLVRPSGPRWESVWDVLPAHDGTLWISTGYPIFGKTSLLAYKDGGPYRMALVNDQTTFDGRLIDQKNSWDENGSKYIPVTGLAEDVQEGAIIAIGPKGLYQIKEGIIRPLLAFDNTSQNIPKNTNPQESGYQMTPNHLEIICKDTYLIGCEYGGLYLLKKGTDGRFIFKPLDDDISHHPHQM